MYEACDFGVAPKRLEDGQDAGYFVGREESGQVGEGGDEDYAGEGGLLRGEGWRGVDEGEGKVFGVGVGEIERGCGSYGGAEGLAEKHGAGGRM